MPLPQLIQVHSETLRVARALVVVPEPPQGLDRPGIAVLVARPLDTHLDQVPQRADHVGGMAGFPQPDQLQPLLVRPCPGAATAVAQASSSESSLMSTLISSRT